MKNKSVFQVIPPTDTFEHWVGDWRNCPCIPKIDENYTLPNSRQKGIHVSHNLVHPRKEQEESDE